MNQKIFREFFPSTNMPLIVSFVNHLTENDYTAVIEFGFWDFLVYEDDGNPVLAVKSVKNSIMKDEIFSIATDKTPQKVILVEGEEIHYGRLESIRVFLASLGVGLFIRGFGWWTYPHYPLIVPPDDLAFKLSKRWTQDEEGFWVKKCTKCHKWKGPEEFYRRPQKTAKDPYRNICKGCF
jgi:hypothetical protein